MDSKELAKCLSDAADLLEGAELAKEHFEEVRYSHELHREVPVAFCLIGAVRHACPENLRRLGDNLDKRLETQVSKLLGFKALEKVFEWNDRKKRKKEEVVARLRQGAERAKLGAVS